MRLPTIILTILTINSCTQRQATQNEVKIDLRGRHLTQIPDSVFMNTNITYLDLGSSEITFYPPLSALVDNNSNEITSLPDKIGELNKLKTLILNTNKLTTLPDAITKLSNLEILDLSINNELDIVQQLDKLKQLPKLKVLKIVDVKLRIEQIDIVKSSFPADTKIIMTIPEYIQSSQWQVLLVTYKVFPPNAFRFWISTKVGKHFGFANCPSPELLQNLKTLSAQELKAFYEQLENV